MNRTFYLGTRGSALALAQARIVMRALHEIRPGVRVEMRVIRTEGDRNQAAPLRTIGGRGVFAGAIETQLAASEIDIAVHCLKDLPSTATPGLVLAAVLARESPFDVLVTRDGAPGLPTGARIGTGSARRAVFLRALFPDARIEEIRGNVDTRLRKLDTGAYDALVLAEAGLRRLDLSGRITRVFSAADMLPAPGQGALTVQCRADDDTVRTLLRALDDAPTHAATEAERAFLRVTGAGCRLPVAALGLPGPNQTLTVHGAIGEDGASAPHIVRAALHGDAVDAQGLGERLATQLLARFDDDAGGIDTALDL
jgi:hydroxymethylbilane synthase